MKRIGPSSAMVKGNDCDHILHLGRPSICCRSSCGIHQISQEVIMVGWFIVGIIGAVLFYRTLIIFKG